MRETRTAEQPADRTAGDRRPSALVTGGAGGIGAAIAEQLVRSGMEVTIADLDPEAAAQTARRISAHHVVVDVGSAEGNRAMVRHVVDRHTGLDVLVLNAGIGEPPGYPDTFDPAGYQRMLQVNLGGVVHGVHSALPHLRPGGSIVVVASLAGLHESPFTPLYGAGKHAVVGLVRSLGPVLQQRSLRINAVCPASVDTAMISSFKDAMLEAGVAVLSPLRVAEAVDHVLTHGGHGEAWCVVPHQDPYPFPFADVPELMAEPGTKMRIR